MIMLYFHVQSVLVICIICFSCGAFAQGQFRDRDPAVTKWTFDSSIKDIQWVGQDEKTVLVQTYGDKLWRSPDTGKLKNLVSLVFLRMQTFLCI